MIVGNMPMGIIESVGGVASFAVDTDGNLTTGLLAVLDMEDASDSSGNISTGTDTAVTYGAGVLSNAATFNGSTSKIEFGDDLNMLGTDTRSWSFWFKWSAAQSGYVISKGVTADHSTVGWGIVNSLAAGNGDIYLQLNAGASFGVNELQQGIRDAAHDDGTWRHCVITYDGSESATGVLFYINGVVHAKLGATSDTLSNSIATSANTFIGVDTASAFINGSIDQLTIWDRVISANNISDMYGSGSGNVYTSG